MSSHISQQVAVVVVLLATLSRLIDHVIYDVPGTVTPPAAYLGVTVELVTRVSISPMYFYESMYLMYSMYSVYFPSLVQALVAIMMRQEFVKGVHTSGVPFIYWTLSLFCDVITFRSAIVRLMVFVSILFPDIL